MGLAGVSEDVVVGTGYVVVVEYKVGVDRMASIRVGTALVEGAVAFRVFVGFSGRGWGCCRRLGAGRSLLSKGKASGDARDVSALGPVGRSMSWLSRGVRSEVVQAAPACGKGAWAGGARVGRSCRRGRRRNFRELLWCWEGHGSQCGVEERCQRDGSTAWLVRGAPTWVG